MQASGLNSLKERMSRSMQVTFNKESEIIEKNLTFLATCGSTAPFIGLFGTVWGIMNSFQSIAIALALGKSTGIPTVKRGAVTIKTINKTSITSTNGVTFISLIWVKRFFLL